MLASTTIAASFFRHSRFARFFAHFEYRLRLKSRQLVWISLDWYAYGLSFGALAQRVPAVANVARNLYCMFIPHFNAISFKVVSYFTFKTSTSVAASLPICFCPSELLFAWLLLLNRCRFLVLGLRMLIRIRIPLFIELLYVYHLLRSVHLSAFEFSAHNIAGKRQTFCLGWSL